MRLRTDATEVLTAASCGSPRIHDAPQLLFSRLPGDHVSLSRHTRSANMNSQQERNALALQAGSMLDSAGFRIVDKPGTFCGAMASCKWAA